MTASSLPGGPSGGLGMTVAPDACSVASSNGAPAQASASPAVHGGVPAPPTGTVSSSASVSASPSDYASYPPFGLSVSLSQVAEELVLIVREGQLAGFAWRGWHGAITRPRSYLGRRDRQSLRDGQPLSARSEASARSLLALDLALSLHRMTAHERLAFETVTRRADAD